MTKTKFDKMTAAEKRVAIAKDVIKHVKSKRFKIEHGQYYDILTPTVSQKEINTKGFTCSVCAAAAAVMAGIGLFNDDTLKRSLFAIDSGKEVLRVGNRWFSHKQLALIEAAFEDESLQLLRQLSDSIVETESSKLRTAAWRESFPTNQEDKNVIAIFQNIIDNNGTFKP